MSQSKLVLTAQALYANVTRISLSEQFCLEWGC